MQFSSLLLPIVLLASSVAAVGELAFDLGVQAKSGDCKTADDYAADFKALSPYTKKVRIYSAQKCNGLEILGKAAEAAGFSYYIGVWPDTSDSFSADKSTLSSVLPLLSASNILGVTVGSEALYRKDMTASALADAISEVKQLLSGLKDKDGNSYSSIQVGTVDSWNVLVDSANSEVIKTADMVFANAFSYWQGQVMNNASYSFVDDIMQALQVIQTTKGTTNIDFWVGETGWATGGAAYQGSADPNVSNAKQFWQEAVCGIRAWGVNVIAFEAFDESWKPVDATNDIERYWGVFDADRNLKYSLDCNFS